MSGFDYFQQRVKRENGIRNMRNVAFSLYTIYGEVDYGTIKEECPGFTPRERAMVRSIMENNGIVDYPAPPDDEG